MLIDIYIKSSVYPNLDNIPYGGILGVKYIISNYMRKITLEQRLNIIKGQIDGLTNLIDKKEDCRKIISQFYAINSGIKKAIELYLTENLNFCLKTVPNLKSQKTINFLLKEIIQNK